MKWYEVKLMVGVSEETYKDWDCGCDEIFHGPAGQLHDPENNVYCFYCEPTTESKMSEVKYHIFDEFGGI